MDKKYLAKIIATDNEGLRMISACCAGAEVKFANIKYLENSKVFLLYMKRLNIEVLNEDIQKHSKFIELLKSNLHNTIIGQDDLKLAKKDEETLVPDCGACGLCWQSQKPVVFLTH